MTAQKRTDRAQMRAMNAKLVLDVVRSAGTASQADLIAATALSTATIVSIVKELRGQGLLVEAGQGASRGGRRPTLLALNPAAALVLACRVGSGTATAGVLDLNGTVLSRRELAIEPGLGPDCFMAALAACLRDQLRHVAQPGDGVAGLGLSLHGPVDAERGVLLFSEHLGWQEVPFRDDLERLLGMPVAAEAETRAVALAEQCWGAARGAQDFVLIEMDSGIGMTQVLGGRLCRGRHSLAGELGFTAWETGPGTLPRRPRVLEQIASLRTLCEQAAKLAGARDRETAKPGRGRLPEAEWLAWLNEAARAGDPRACRLLDDAARALGLAVANVINLLDPELVLLTGRMVSGPESSLLSQIRVHAGTLLVGRPERAPGIEMAALGADAALRGAARLVIDRFFSVESLAAGRKAGPSGAEDGPRPPLTRDGHGDAAPPAAPTPVRAVRHRNSTQTPRVRGRARKLTGTDPAPGWRRRRHG